MSRLALSTVSLLFFSLAVILSAREVSRRYEWTVALIVRGHRTCGLRSTTLPSASINAPPDDGGRIASRSEGHLAISLVLLWSVVACLAADSVWFWLGRRWGSPVIRLICSLTSDPQGSQERPRRVFDHWGLRILLVAKFIPVMDGCFASASWRVRRNDPGFLPI